MDREKLREIAKSLRFVLVVFLVSLVLGLGNMGLASALGKEGASIVLLLSVVGWMLLPVAAFGSYKLATALGKSGVLFAILALLPCAGLIALLVLSQAATGELKNAGIKVGLLGANPDSI